ncbi:sigma-70 family RNA polymerase sigma factor [Bacillaceae bacterium IKA-2]|nr:sigma-70 family RNA polymerase sigma factor [Bacillaceae bacterium IKA-2]
MMKITYEFATGEIIEIEIEEALGEVVIELEKNEYNGNRRETRRHESYSDDNDKQEVLVDKSIDIETMAEWNADKKNLNNAISKLKPHQQELVKKIFYQGLSETEVAREMGVSQQAISKQLKVIYKNLKNFLD